MYEKLLILFSKYICSVLIDSPDGDTAVEIKDYFGGNAIDISSLKPGNYSIKIYDGKQLVNQQRIYIESR